MLNDLKARHLPNSNAAKLARAMAYLREHNISAVSQGNRFRYTSHEHGSRLLKGYRA